MNSSLEGAIVLEYFNSGFAAVVGILWMAALVRRAAHDRKH